MASDDGPVETMREHVAFVDERACEIRLNRSRMRPVLRKSRCRSSTMIRKMRPAASLRGRDGGRMMPSCVGGGGGASRLWTRPPWTSVKRRDVLLDAVLVDLEVVLRQVGDELILGVADDRVHRHQSMSTAEVRLRTLRRRSAGGSAVACPAGA